MESGILGVGEEKLWIFAHPVEIFVRDPGNDFLAISRDGMCELDWMIFFSFSWFAIIYEIRWKVSRFNEKNLANYQLHFYDFFPLIATFFSSTTDFHRMP